ncbi:STAS-like domain-containing protein [Proteus sp. NGCRVN-01]|uniref:STAS-like domain-containing protein n=1 Tax=Proteus sp. NGCRVN-01 TaxID=3380534 RepID=UPI003871BA6B
MSKIKVADRYPCPGPRYKRLGPSSGEEFREWIEKELKKSVPLTIDLDGTEGYGSSFLEESFGGLIRKNYPVELVKSIVLISNEEPELIDEINEYINDAVDDMKKA